MAVVPGYSLKGRDFTAEELIGRTIRIEAPGPTRTKPMGYAVMVLADGEMVNNVLNLELAIEPNAVVEARLTLDRGKTAEPETVTLRDNIELSFSAIVSEVQG